MSKSRIIKFGNIREDKYGRIVFEYFQIEGGGDGDDVPRMIIQRVIDRLENLLDSSDNKKHDYENIS